MMPRSSLMLAGCLLAGFPVTKTIGGDWPHWRGPHENGIASDVLPAEPDFEKISWRAKVGVGFSSLAIANGRVFTLGHDGGEETVWCLDAHTGEVIWSDTYEAALLPNLHEGGPSATPAVDRAGRVFTLSKDGKVHGYRAETGERIWQRDMLEETGMRKPPEWGFAGSPVLQGEQLIIEAGATFALDRRNGEVLWKSRTYTPAYGTPVFFQEEANVRMAVLKTEGLVVLNPASGVNLAFAEWKTAFSTNANTPIVRDDMVFISTGYDRGCALFRFNGSVLEKRYENKSMCNHMNNSVLVGEHLYGFDGTAHRGRPTEFVCMEFSTGKEKWRVPPDEGLFCGSVIVTGDRKLVILTERGELVAAPASPEKFEPTARAQVLGGRCWTPPAMAGGRIYCRNARGDLVCVEP